MLRNYLKVAFRNLRKEKLYTSVNIVGLAVGIASCLLIMLFVRHEWSYDRFHVDAERLYRAWGKEDWGEGREFFYTVTPVPLAEALEENIPEVETTVRIRAFGGLVGPEGRRFSEDIRMVDTSFFDVFDFDLPEGRDVFAEPNSVVLTRETAHKYFGEEPAVGKTLSIEIADEPQDYLVTGIAESPPAASSIQFDLLLPFTEAPDFMSPGEFTNWFSISLETYVLLEDGASARAVEAKLPALVQQYLGEEAEPSGYEIGLQPMTDIHLNTDYPVGIEPTSDPVYSYFLAGIALLVLVVASINFVTLSIGQSATRTAEVGIRKAIGAGRPELMRQFWGEATLVVVLAVLAGLVLGRFALPVFNNLTAIDLELAAEPYVALFLVGLTALIALVAGIYPAVVLSGLRPVEVLRGRIEMRRDRNFLRRGLVVVQLSISILMIVATLFVTRQLDYLQEKELGFEKEQVVVVRTGYGGEETERIAKRLQAHFRGHPSVQTIAYSAFPVNDGWARLGFEADDGAYAGFTANLVSPEFLDALDVDLIAGRGFSRERTADSTGMIVNEAFVREFRFASAAEALGGRLPSRSFGEHEIIGVVRDFNYESLHSSVGPLVLVRSPDWLLRGAADVSMASSMQRDLSIRIAPGSAQETVSLLQQAWSRVAPDQPFAFYFLDEAIDSQYRQEERLGQIVGTGSVLAILIACLGLFSLAALTVVRRRKEIGVRRVLGATVSSIVVLLARDFTLLVGIAFLVSAPVGYALVSNWLENFAYRVEVGPLTFLAAGLLALSLAVVTVSYQSIRAALTDPVKSLRYE